MTAGSKNNDLLEKLGHRAGEGNRIDRSLYQRYSVKRGLRNDDGTGVLVGLTEIGEVHAYIVDEGEKVPIEGRLFYRGIDLFDFVRGFAAEGRPGFEECAYLLLFGSLPGSRDLAAFNSLLSEYRCGQDRAEADLTLRNPSANVMNNLARSVLGMYAYDERADDTGIDNVVRQCLSLIARFPVLASYGYQLASHYHRRKSLIIHTPEKNLGTAENFLHMTRPDSRYSRSEAEILDLCLVLHAEHGGGNNSTFTTHVVTSSGTDIYSAVAAAIGSLKGPKHGGANIKVMEMINDIRENCGDPGNPEKVRLYLARMIRGEVFDRAGLIYGLGHAVYTLSDPRAILLREKARELASEKGLSDELALFEMVEQIGPEVFREAKKTDRPLCANVDLYSGFVYRMLGIPVELYTPLFAIARVTGWCAHIIEEILNGGRIIRPAYKNVLRRTGYLPLAERDR